MICQAVLVTLCAMNIIQENISEYERDAIYQLLDEYFNKAKDFN